MLKTLARNAIWNGMGTAGGILLGVLTSAMIARQFGPAGTGTYKYILWWVAVAVTLINLGLPNAVARFTAEFLGRDDPASARGLLRRVVMLELGLGGIAACLAVSGIYWLAPPELRIPLVVAGMVVVPAVLANVLQAGVYGAQDFRAANRASVLISAAQFVLTFLVLRAQWGLAGVLAVVLVRHLAYALFLAWYLKDLFPGWSTSPSLPTTVQRRVLVYVRDMTAILVITAVVWDSSEVFFLNRYSTPEQVAFYALAFEYAAKAMSIPAMFSGVLMPSVSALYGRADQSNIERVFIGGSRLIGFVALPIGLGGAAIAPAFAPLVFGLEYKPVGLLLSVLLVFNVFGALAAINSAVVFGTNDQFFVVKLGLAVAVLNLALDLLLIPRWAALGAVVANSTSQIAASVVGYAYVALRLGAPVPLAALSRAGIAAAGCAVVAYAATLAVPGWLGLAVAMALAAATYVLLLVLMRALASEDVAMLNQLADLLPSPVGRPYRRVVGWFGR